MRIIDADAAADKIMREVEKRAGEINMMGIALLIGMAKMLRDENDFPTIKPVNRAAILRLLDEADVIVNALYKQGANKSYKCKKLREKLKAIEKEVTGDAGND